MGRRERQKTLVLGVGNPLMGDEGVGPRVVEHLLSFARFPDNVDVVDAGTMGFSMLNLLRDADVVIVVDAVRGSGHEPGTVVMLDPESMAPNQVMHSLHDARLTDVLDAANLMGLDPDVVCIGVEVAEIVHWKLELTPAVEKAVQRAAGAVIDLLLERGADVEAAEGGPVARPSGRRAEQASILRSLRTKDDVGARSPHPADEEADLQS